MDDTTAKFDQICEACTLGGSQGDKPNCKIRLFVKGRSSTRIYRNAADICAIVSEVVAEVNLLIKEANAYDDGIPTTTNP